MDLTRRDMRPELAFREIPYPSAAPPLTPLADEADGNARTFFAWGRAHLWADQLAKAFPDPPPGALWAFDASEHEMFVGEWPEGDLDFYASISIGLLFDPADASAAAFAERVVAERPRDWPSEAVS